MRNKGCGYDFVDRLAANGERERGINICIYRCLCDIEREREGQSVYEREREREKEREKERVKEVKWCVREREGECCERESERKKERKKERK
jgi:hypothetical protein